MLILRVLYVALIIFVIYRLFKGGGCCGGHHMGHGGHGSQEGHKGHSNHKGGCCSHDGNDQEEQKQSTMDEIKTYKDPVCGMYVSADSAVIKHINGQIYYFCSESCAKEFEKMVKRIRDEKVG